MPSKAEQCSFEVILFFIYPWASYSGTLYCAWRYPIGSTCYINRISLSVDMVLFLILRDRKNNIVKLIEGEWHIPSSLLYKTHQIPTLKRFSYCLAAGLAESIEARSQVENEDVVGAAPTGDAPTTSEWSTILFPTKVRLILEMLRYIRQAITP